MTLNILGAGFLWTSLTGLIIAIVRGGTQQPTPQDLNAEWAQVTWATEEPQP